MTDNYFTRLIGGAALACWALVALALVAMLWEPGAINAVLGCGVSAVIVTVLRINFWRLDRRGR